VRLKGDPFIFGGSEEIEFVESFGIPTFVVPISSSIAVPTSQGISLTKRSFREFLGDYRNNFRKLSTDVALAARQRQLLF
jgi:uroporphyrin-III C-methyltransferase